MDWQPIETYDGFGIVIFADSAGHVWPGHRHNSRRGTSDEFIWFTGSVAHPTHWMQLPKHPDTVMSK
jgi:hypothetical protein